MSATTRADAVTPKVSQPKVNTLAMVSVALVVVATASMFIGGGAVVFVFAVGPAHVALRQIKARRERGAILAFITLGISYAFALYALLGTVYLGVRYLLQL